MGWGACLRKGPSGALSFAKMSTGTNEISSCLATKPSRASKPSGLVAALHSSLGRAGSPQASTVFRALSDWVFETALWQTDYHMPPRECQGKCGINHVSVVLCRHTGLRFLLQSWAPLQGKAILAAVNQVSERFSQWILAHRHVSLESVVDSFLLPVE